MTYQSDIMNKNWYYQIEVEKGVFTPGFKFGNFALTRRLLRNIDTEGVEFLDIGTQEAVIPILLKKSGASKVVAYDRFNKSDQINFLKDRYNVDFDYIHGIQLDALPKTLDETHGRFFDVVVFSGVLYHMINPMGLLALVRGLCKSNGLFVIETAVMNRLDQCLLFNGNGKLYGKKSSNYFVPTTGWLEYTLRMLGLEPLEAVYMDKASKTKVIRLAILCRSHADPCPSDKKDAWVHQIHHKRIFANECQVDWQGISDNKAKENYRPAGKGTIKLNGKDSLFKSVLKSRPFDINQDDMVLFMNSKL